jgi:F-type H+-transporting ATPase subunit b
MLMENMVLLANFRPLFAIDFDTVLFTLINTAIIVIMYFFFLHRPVSQMLENRKQAVKDELDAATASKEKAAAAEKEYLEKLVNSKVEANKIISAATQKAREWEEEMVAEVKKEVTQLRQKADEDIERERKRAVNDIKNQITDIVIMAAGAVAEKEISVQDNAALIESFLVNAGD